MSADQLDALLAAIRPAPALPGANCRGRWALFDERRPDEDADDYECRQNTALRLCRSCCALASCERWFDSLRPSQRPPGVVAGRVNQPKTVGRPRKEQPA